MQIETVRYILSAFLENWQDRPEYIGALVTGSYADNTATDTSDIDLRLLFSDDSQLIEMGECNFGGKEISFTGSTKLMYVKIFEEELNTPHHYEIYTIASAIYLDGDKTEVQELISVAQEYSVRKISPRNSEKIDIAIELHQFFKAFKDIPENSPFFSLAYFELTQHIFKQYAYYLGVLIPYKIKHYKNFFDTDSTKNRRRDIFPDAVFVNKYLLAVQKQSINNISDLYYYTINQISDNFGTSDYIVQHHLANEVTRLFLIEA